SYLDDKFSHACVTRRMAEVIGVENIVPIGVRSYSAEEAEVINENKLKFYSADRINERGMKTVISEALDYLRKTNIYLSIDMDVFDPAYAPGVGNPEFFGLTPWQIREGIELIGQYLIGVDIVEVSPPFDNGNTAALAAQLIQIIIANTSKTKH
ncbi:MAG: arginase family protein, partial [Thermoplasmata archaeon]|nr:arginase family protein [Thermoplasmata archaeon]